MKNLLGFVIFFTALKGFRRTGNIEFTLALNVDDRFNCFPEENPKQDTCEKRGCIWSTPSTSGAPTCFYNSSSKIGYVVEKTEDTSLGLRLYLKLTVPNGATHPYTSDIFKQPIVYVVKETENRLRIKFYDKGAKRYEVPVGETFQKVKTESLKTNYEFKYTNDSYFQVFAKRKNKTMKIWDTSVGALIMSEQFLQVSTKLPSTNLYGFGEKARGSFKQDFNWKKITMFSRDQFPYSDINLYGVHPFYMMIEDDGNAHGVLLLNSNAMEVEFQPTPALTYRAVGGVLDFYFFFGPTPENVVQQYTELIGRPMLPSYWSLGFQLCRWGYNSLDEVKKTVNRMKEYDIPQDVQYGDIDYMERQLDFVVNNKTYAGLGDYVREIKKDGIKYITILDPAISSEEPSGTYEAFDLGQKLGIWIKNQTGHPIIGKVWPDKPNVTEDPSWTWDEKVQNLRAEAVFPDFFHENITAWWNVLIQKFHQTLEFDGLWIDMNEVANFVAGSVNGCQNKKYEEPPFVPKMPNLRLSEKTLCMDAVHDDGEIEYNYHSLYGWKQSQITRQALTETTKKRGLVISRSTYVSSGKYIGHWLGDNRSEWPEMHYSIIGMMDMSLFGIPYSGADICGFFENTNYNLCLRWMQLGAFYPYSRNHNNEKNKPQDPAYFDKNFAKISRDVLHIRYTLLPYLYTLFFNAHTRGDTVVRPMFHEFPQDKETLAIDKQFLWGPALLITPILEENATSVKAYLPNATWYEWYTLRQINTTQSTVAMDIPLNQIGLHIRGGHIIPTQEPANNTMYSRKKPFGLLVALDENSEASGSLFWDDGDSLDSVANNEYLALKFVATKENVRISVTVNGSKLEQPLYFSSITILGLTINPVNNLRINGRSANEENVTMTYENKVLKIKDMKLSIVEHHNITWSELPSPTPSVTPSIAPSSSISPTQSPSSTPKSDACVLSTTHSILYCCICILALVFIMQ